MKRPAILSTLILLNAFIIGLPYPEDDPDTLETLAGALAEQSRLAWRL